MASSSQPPPPPSTITTENPIVAVGRKVKSVLSSHQRPSIRILRESSSAEQSLRAPASKDIAEKSAPNLSPHGPDSPAEYSAVNAKRNTFANRFADARKRTGVAMRALFSREEDSIDDESFEHEYDPDTVDLLDVMDPEVSILSTLTNVQNSLFVPSLGKFVNRQPMYRISESPTELRTINKLKNLLKKMKTSVKETTSTVSKFEYAVLPDGEKLEGWTSEDKEELDDLVRHKLHSRRARFKRSLKGFGQYVRRRSAALGLFITVYATLITLFGAAWVLFLIGWISLGSKEDYVVNVVDNVLVALFAIIGDGLAPFRAVDTYHMIYIAYYHRKTWKKRESLGLPELPDQNDLPDQRKEDSKPEELDIESLVARKMPRGLARRIAPRIPKKFALRMVARSKVNDPVYEYSVLTPEQQAKLEYHERKFSKSHTFYKPHETETHFAFPLKLLVAVVLLLDLHSCLQITLGACTWGISYHTRPFALTTVILCCSITCNITGGVLISIGDKRTRKKDAIERIMRQELTSEAIEQIETRQLKEAEERGEIHPSVRKRREEEKEEKENEEIKRSWKNVPKLPKTLLGKGEDHRQPSLPQEARRSSSTVAVSDTAFDSDASKKSRSKIKSGLWTVQEGSAVPQLSRPQPALRRGEEPRQGTGQKVMALIRRADLDRS